MFLLQEAQYTGKKIVKKMEHFTPHCLCRKHVLKCLSLEKKILKKNPEKLLNEFGDVCVLFLYLVIPAEMRLHSLFLNKE